MLLTSAESSLRRTSMKHFDPASFRLISDNGWPAEKKGQRFWWLGSLQKEERIATKVYEFSATLLFHHVAATAEQSRSLPIEGDFFSLRISLSLSHTHTRARAHTHTHTHTHGYKDTVDRPHVHSQTRKAAGVLCSYRHPSGSERQSLTEMMVRCAVCGSKMISIGGDTARFAITIVEYYRPATPLSLSLSLSSLFSFFILVRSTLACLNPLPLPPSPVVCLHPLCASSG